MALKPCPDCGATTIEEYGPMLKRVGPLEKHRHYYMIQCQKCHKETKLFKTEEEAVEEWNKTAEDEKIKLKSCPFCGSKEGTAGEPTVEPESTEIPEDDPYGYHVRCHWCGAETDSYTTRKKAAEAWNRRAGEEKP